MKRLATGRMFGQTIPASIPRVDAGRLPDASRASSPVEAVATAVRPTIAGEDGSGNPDLRPLWYMLPDGTPVEPEDLKKGIKPTRWCREGDTEWRRMDEF